MTWAEGDPASRTPFLCAFYPLFEKDGAGKIVWHPALEMLAKKFGQCDGFRQALDDRLHVSAWSGSLIPYLEAYFDPLEAWSSHTIPQLSGWAREMRRTLERRIAWERDRDEESPYR